MLRLLRFVPSLFVAIFRSRFDLLLENLALRQQLAVLKQLHHQPRLAPSDRVFWVMLRQFWPGWKQVLILVQPETVVRWHRTEVGTGVHPGSAHRRAHRFPDDQDF